MTLELNSLISNEEPKIWLFYGDSITHGCKHLNGHRDYTELFEERVKGELSRRNDVVINTAISGNTTRDLLEGFEHRVSRFKPDVIFLMIGMNDCDKNKNLSLEEYEENLNKLINQMKALNTEVILQTTIPIIPGLAPEREFQFESYMEVVRGLARKYELPLIDHLNYWKGCNCIFWMSNAYHPNEYGHRVLAHKIFKEMDIFDEESRTCRLYVH